jgi:hypothetical protein
MGKERYLELRPYYERALAVKPSVANRLVRPATSGFRTGRASTNKATFAALF